MIGDEGYSLGYRLLESQRKQLKVWKARQSNPAESASSCASDSEDSQTEQAQKKMAKNMLKASDSQGYKALFTQKPSIEIIRKILLPYIIRRTSKSRTPEGNLIINIPDYIESIAWVKLTDIEKKALSDLYTQLMNEKPDGLVFCHPSLFSVTD